MFLTRPITIEIPISCAIASFAYMIPRLLTRSLCSDWLASSSCRSVFCWHLATTTPKKIRVGMLFIRTWIQAAKFRRRQMLCRAGTALIGGRSGTNRLAGGGLLLAVGGQVPDLRSGSTHAPLAISNGSYGTHGTYGVDQRQTFYRHDARLPSTTKTLTPRPTLNHVIARFSDVFDEPERGVEFREVGIAFVI